MKVDFYAPINGGFGNVLWFPSYPMQNGILPASHPCADNPKPLVSYLEEQPVSDDPLGRFRALSYYASCFPEGDGISFYPPMGKTTDDMVDDIKKCFGFEVQVKRN